MYVCIIDQQDNCLVHKNISTKHPDQLVKLRFYLNDAVTVLSGMSKSKVNATTKQKQFRYSPINWGELFIIYGDERIRSMKISSGDILTLNSFGAVELVHITVTVRQNSVVYET